MRAARLKNRVKIQRFTESQDSTGFGVKTWATIATVWAAVEVDAVTRTGEKESAAELIAARPISVFIRYSSDVSDVSEVDRVLFGTRIFSIEFVTLPTDRSGSNAIIELRCLEGKKDGA